METKTPSTEASEDSTTQLILNKDEILDQIAAHKKYTSGDGVTIQKWEGEELTDHFVSEIKKNSINFVGVLNTKLQKDNYGVMTYPNGEKYFGMYQKEFRNKQGIYVYQPKIEGDELLSEFYFGVWRDNQKDDHGVYLWLSENKDIAPFSNFDASFDCFTGDIDNETFSHGTYMKKNGNDYYLYHGGFNQHNEMNGDDCYFYNANKDELIYGKVRHNKFITGYIALFDEDGKLQHIMQCDFDDNGKITSYLQKEEIEVETLGKVCNYMETFRNVILGEDYFGILYNVFKKTKEYMDEKLNTLEAFDSSEEFPKLMSITFKFNEIKIYQNIEKNII